VQDLRNHVLALEVLKGLVLKRLPGYNKPVKLLAYQLLWKLLLQNNEDALHFGVDVLWIGARTTVNPFSVQDVADALRGVDVPVLI
jgi:chorismate mutase